MSSDDASFFAILFEDIDTVWSTNGSEGSITLESFVEQVLHSVQDNKFRHNL